MIPQCRFTRFVKIGESATRRAILPMDFSLLSWWEATYMLQILLLDDAMKLINILYLSRLFWNQCLAGKACPMGDTSSPKFLLNKDSVQNFCVEFVACCLHADCSSWQPTYPHSISTFMCQYMQSSIDTCRSMLPPPVSAQSAFAL